MLTSLRNNYLKELFSNPFRNYATGKLMEFSRQNNECHHANGPFPKNLWTEKDVNRFLRRLVYQLESISDTKTIELLFLDSKRVLDITFLSAKLKK